MQYMHFELPMTTACIRYLGITFAALRLVAISSVDVDASACVTTFDVKVTSKTLLQHDSKTKRKLLHMDLAAEQRERGIPTEEDGHAEEKDSDLTEQVLALFPESHMPRPIKDAIRQQHLILELTQWMRNLSEKYWGGSCNTSDLDFWQSHQWNGSKSELWIGSNLSVPAQWTGQPNRLDGQALPMPHESNVWFVTTRYNVLLDGGFPTDQLQSGMTFNHMTNTEWFRKTGFVMHYGHELAPVQRERRPFAPYKLSQSGSFTPYQVTFDGTTWTGFMLKGPGYVVDFTGVVHDVPNADGSPNIYHAAVYGEEMASAEMNLELEAAFQQQDY